MYKDLIDKLECRSCGCGYKVEIMTSPYPGVIDEGRLKCEGCGKILPVRDGILECSPLADDQLKYWEDHYEAEDQEPIAEAIERGLEEPRLLNNHYPLLRMTGDLPLESSVELGCGSGAFSLVLKASGKVDDVTLLDYSWKSLLAARELFLRFGAGCNLVHSRLEDAPFKKHAFSLSLSAGVIEHYKTKEERLVCLGAHLDSGRYAFVQAPVSAPGYWLPRIFFTVAKSGWPFGYERPVTMREMRSLINKSGAKLIKKDHQYFLSFPLFTKGGRLIRPGWYTRLFENEIAVVAQKAPDNGSH